MADSRVCDGTKNAPRSVMLGQNTSLESDRQHRAIHILARSISRELLNQGYECRHLVDLASELLDVACDSFHTQRVEQLDIRTTANRLAVELDPEFRAPAPTPAPSPWWQRQWERLAPPARAEPARQPPA